MIRLKLLALLAILIGLGGCVVPIDDGRGGGYYRSGNYGDTSAGWRDDPDRRERRHYEDQRFEQRGDRRFDSR